MGNIIWKKPFESYNNPHNEITLTLHIINGKREIPIVGTPADDYVNIYKSMNINSYNLVH